MLLTLSLATSYRARAAEPTSLSNVKRNEVTAPVASKVEGIDNFFQLSDRIYSGSAPEGDTAFAALQKLGVKTLITVDGTKPNIELAHKYGLHYVHLPHGYNGISTNIQAQLIKAAQTVPGPIFIHCHHGKHRGPTAAAVVCMATEGWSSAKAEAWLVTAGTATNYTGLFKTVRDFKEPSPDKLRNIPANFPEIATLPGLVDAMVAIDEQWDHLKEIRKAGYQTPKEHKDLDGPTEVLILREHFREAQRLPESSRRGEVFLQKLKTAETNVEAAENLFLQFKSDGAAETRVRLDKALDVVSQSCAACHKTYRDPALINGEKR
jgi:protein tyrosine phosphatase (PTP) superfamily phosphohydrolase (DUF442 family)